MYPVYNLFELLYTYIDTLSVSNHNHPPFKEFKMATSFALNNTASITTNYDQFFNKFHSYTVEGESILLSEMSKDDLKLIRKVLVDRYDFYASARKLRDFIDALLESGGEVEQPCPYKSMLTETFGISFEEMTGKEIASRDLVEETCQRIKALPDFANWKTTTNNNDKENEVGNTLLEFEFKFNDNSYVYAKLVKCGDIWSIRTRSNGNMMTWHSIQCSDVLEALNYVARRFW